jgi:hypothetical protein
MLGHPATIRQVGTMIRDSVVVKAHATPPDCHEVRQWFTPVLSGGTSLTERALVEAHLRCCAPCREDESRLRDGATARGAGSRHRLLGHFGKVMTLMRIAVAGGATLSVRLHALPSRALRPPLNAVKRLERAGRTGINHSTERLARLRPVPASALLHLAWAGRRVLRSISLGFTSCAHATVGAMSCFAARMTRVRPRLVVGLRMGIGTAGLVVMFTLTAPALQWMSRPQEPARARTPPLARVEPAPIESSLESPPVAPPVEPPRATQAPAPPVRPRRSPSGAGAAAQQPPRLSGEATFAGPVAAPEHEAPASTAAPEHDAPASTVVGRLSAQNRVAAEQDLTALLAGVNGTEVGRQRHPAFVAVRVVVAHSRYDDFTRGLTRIGAWQLEAARSPLPDTVHMTIRVTD